MEFPRFSKKDFSAFASHKARDPGYNDERIVVWNKMKVAKEFIDPMLGQTISSMTGSVARYWPNPYNRFHVGEIWIRYSERTTRYFEYPHFSFGINGGGFPYGVVINPAATAYLARTSSLIDQGEPFLNEFYKLRKACRFVECGNVHVNGDPSKSSLRRLSQAVSRGEGWFCVGEFTSAKEYSKSPEELPFNVVRALRKLPPLLHLLSGKRLARQRAGSGNEWDEGDEPEQRPQKTTVERGKYERGQPHKELSKAFRDWIRENCSTQIRKEKQGIDVEFMLGSQSVCAELKSGAEGDSRTLLRNALGQLLEYNYYPSRESADQWMVVLDIKRSKLDMDFVTRLRSLLPKPLVLGWQEDRGFDFHPRWP